MSRVETLGAIPRWTVRDRLRKAREHAALQQGELAERIGVGRSTISNYEAGVTEPKRPILLSWAMATGVPLEWLVSGDQKPAGYRFRLAA